MAVVQNFPLPTKSSGSRKTTTKKSLLSFPLRPTLGDKLQHLASVSPAHLKVVELLVDEMLKSTAYGASQTFWRGIVAVWISPLLW